MRRIALSLALASCKSEPTCDDVAAHMISVMSGEHPTLPGLAALEAQMASAIAAECVEAPYPPEAKACLIAAKNEASVHRCMGAPDLDLACPAGATLRGPQPVETARANELAEIFGSGIREWEAFCVVGTRRQGPYRRVKDREVEERGEFKDNRRDGVWELRVGERVVERTHYRAGDKHGTQTTYNVDGSKDAEGEFADDRQTGLWTEWGADGQPRTKGSYLRGARHGSWATWSKDGSKRLEGTYVDGEMRGDWKFFGPDGSTTLSVTIADDASAELTTSRDGDLERLEVRVPSKPGEHVEWHSGGALKVRGHYLGDQKQGLWTEWAENGTKISEGSFAGGRRQGPWIEWRDDGSKIREGAYVDDELRGEWKFFDRAGALVARVKIEGATELIRHDDGSPKQLVARSPDKPGIHLEWRADGQLKLRGEYLGEAKHGLWTELSDNGAKLREQTFQKGTLQGPSTTWHEGTSQKANEGEYRNGEKQGIWREWHPDGKLHLEGAYVDGQRDGLWTEYHPKGHKWKAGSFRTGTKIGTWITWNSKAEQSLVEQFGAGTPN